MVATLNITVDSGDMVRVQRSLSDVGDAVPKIASVEINKTAKSTRVRIARRIAERVNLRQSSILNTIKLTRATTNKPEGSINIEGREIPLIHFDARQTPAGVSVAGTMRPRSGSESDYEATNPDGRTVIAANDKLSGSFIATMPSRRRGVFRRRRTDDSNTAVPFYARGPKSRAQIFQLLGPSVPELLASDDEFTQQVVTETGQELERNVDNGIKAILTRGRGRDTAADHPIGTLPGAKSFRQLEMFVENVARFTPFI